MSRVGKYPVELPAGVQVAIASGILTAKGKLGELSLPLTDLVETKVEGNKVSVAPKNNETKSRMMWGTLAIVRPLLSVGSAHSSQG